MAVTLTEDHAVWCKDRWVKASEIGTHAVTPSEHQYVAIETDDYCKDRLLTAAGLAIEGWDGREKSKWRPHEYDDSGRRVRCANRGSWWELLVHFRGYGYRATSSSSTRGRRRTEAKESRIPVAWETRRTVR